jgi:hypothetical protein
MKTIIYNIGTLAGILPEGKLKLEGAEMNHVECLNNAYLIIEDGIITEFGQDVGGCSVIQNRATPLAAGGGARDEVVGGVVFQTTLSNASSRINVTDNSELGLPRAVVRMACSKGTYVRAFARDLGEALGSGAHLDSLQRSRSGIFRVENALTVEQAINLLQA